MQAEPLVGLVLEAGNQDRNEHVQDEEGSHENENHVEKHYYIFAYLLSHGIVYLAGGMCSQDGWYFPVFEGLNFKEGQHGFKYILVVLGRDDPLVTVSQTVNFISHERVAAAAHLSTQSLDANNSEYVDEEDINQG